MDKGFKHNTEATAPGKLAEVRGVDLVICPRCRNVQSVAHVTKPQAREFNLGGEIFTRVVTIRGVWCQTPGCDQMLFDDEAWVEQIIARKEWDKEHGAPTGTSALLATEKDVAA